MWKSVCNQFPKSRKHKKLFASVKQNLKADVGDLERDIDRMVYRLYGLGEEEIGIVEGKNK